LYEQGAIHHPGKELRRSKRYQHVSTVMIESMPAGIVGYAQLRNYSAGGMLIRSEFALSPGTLLRVRLEAPLYASVSDVVDSRVVWCRRLKEDADHYSQFGIGVDLI
jgi:hypothetical protein